MIYPISQVKAYLTSYQGLRDDCPFSSPLEYARQAGCVQYDPLDQVGNNPDLVFQARIPGYRKGDVNKALYQERTLIDAWDKNMAICPVEDWPYLGRFHKCPPQWGNHADDNDRKVIFSYLEDHPFVCSSDLDLPQSRRALEFLFSTGELAVHHRDGTRRYLCLPESIIDSSILAMEDPNKTEEDFWSWYVYRRISSVGCLSPGPSDAYLGYYGPRANMTDSAFRRLEEEGRIVSIPSEARGKPLYIPSSALALLDSATPASEAQVRFLGPLDNLLWDRKLIARVFSFQYTWEVYAPQSQRKYGYYVLPVLYKDDMIGRIEFSYDKKEGKLSVANLWLEEGFRRDKDFNGAYRSALRRFAAYLKPRQGKGFGK